jgi:hypothetical protein
MKHVLHKGWTKIKMIWKGTLFELKSLQQTELIFMDVAEYRMKLWNLVWKTSIFIKNHNYLPFGLLLKVWCRSEVVQFFGLECFFHMSISSEVGGVQMGGGWAEGLRWQWANIVFTHFSDHWLFQPNSNKRPFWQGEPTVPQKGIVSLFTFMAGEKGGGGIKVKEMKKKEEKNQIKSTIKSGSEVWRGKVKIWGC